MRLVERPVFKPHHCAALPQRGQTAAGERWVDTGNELSGFDNHVYLSETAVREAGKLLGHIMPEVHEQVANERAQLQTKLDEAEARIAYLQDALLSARVIERYVDSLTAPEAE